MSKNRIKIQLPTISTREEAESVMNELAHAENNRRQLISIRDGQVLEINKKYEAGIAGCAEDVQEKTDILRAWAESHPEAFPKGRKSLDLVSGILGFRTGTPKLSLLSRAWNWENVLGTLKVKNMIEFIRTKEEVDKESILSFAAEETDIKDLVEKVLTPIGLKVVQDESFFVEPALTKTDARQVALN